MEKYFAQRGTIRHDLAERAHFEWLSGRMGGEDLLRKKYPELYTILMYTRERQLLQAKADRGRGPTEEASLNGLQDSMKIRFLAYHPDKGVDTVSSIHTVEESPSLFMVGNLRDLSHEQALGGFAKCSSNSHKLQDSVTFDADRLRADDFYHFSAETTFVKVCRGENGKPYFDSMTEQNVGIKSAYGEGPVKEITVNDPMPCRHPGADKTIIYYKRSGDGYDYYYDNVDIQSNGIQIYMPFSGSIEFNSYYRPLFVDKNYGFQLHIENIQNGVASFCPGCWKDIKWEIADSKLSWKFPDNWHTTLKRNQVGIMENLDFYCKMYVIAENKNQPGKEHRLPVVITSSDLPFSDPAIKTIKKLEILWGCFAKDTGIKMADGSVKRIQDIRPEERVMSDDGSGEVLELISGEEERMIRIVSGCGHTVTVTEDHPVLTENGWKKARDLTAGDILIMEYGKDSIEQLYVCGYHDRVFSIRTESGGAVIADGFLMGDFVCQNQLRDSEKKTTPSLEAFQEEMSDLASELHARKEADAYGK